MTEFQALLTPAVSIISLVVGALLTEYLRRSNRTELYIPIVFEKRLVAYEGLLERVEKGNEIANEVINNEKLTAEERHELISEALHGVAGYTDKNRLYLDEELSLHCVAMFMGVEDIQNASDEARENASEHYYHMRREALRMIKEDSGVARVNKLFETINRPKLEGPIIEYVREVRQKSGL